MRRSAVVAVALLTAVLVACAPATVAPRPAPSPPPAGAEKIQHLVFIVQENRSFDTYFGTYPGADGIAFEGGVPAACLPDPAIGGCSRPWHSTDLNMQGGPSQMDMFDIKFGKWAPENRDVRATPYGYQYPYGLMPKLADHLGDIAVVRSASAWETVHSRGQYYLQTGHAVSAARIKESPAIGSVVAHEFKSRLKETDFLPPFVSMNYEPTTMYGPLQGEGCLPADCAPLTLDMAARNLPFFVEEKDRARLLRRWEALQQMDSSQIGRAHV